MECENCPGGKTNHDFCLPGSRKFVKKIMRTSRRRFIGEIALAGTAGLTTGSFNILASKGMFIHHVYFWLKNPGNKVDKAKLIEGLQKLSDVKTIKNFYIGQPAATRRDVIESSYDVSWLLFFDSAADQDSYQNDPVHLKFVKECSPLWSKVIVYDSVDV
jgi:hypothetical protein